MALSHPLWLLGLLALPLLPRGRGRLLRAAILATLLLALADPVVPRPAETVAVLADVSDSVGDAALRAAADLRAPEGVRLDVWHYAGEPSEASDLNAAAAQGLNVGRTDLGRALAAATARDVGRVLVIGDGLDTEGDPVSARPDVPVDVMPVGSVENLRLTTVRAPLRATPGSTVRLELALASDRAGPVEVEVRLGDTVVLDRRVEVPAGRSTVPVRITLPEAGPARIEASVRVPWTQPTRDDALALDVDLASRDPVWVVGDPAFADLLEAQGLPVRRMTPGEMQLPIDAGAVVLRGSAADFTARQLEALADWVNDGGGLLMTGGPESFGLGGWYRTPVEAVLPVDSDLRSEVRVPLLAMVMVLDRSGSMAGGAPSKIALARQGAAEVVELAFERDQLGLIAFNDDHDWVFELRPATGRGKLEMLSAIRQLGTGGGTILGPALVEAIDALRDSDASIKHLIVLSDGRLYDGQGPFGGDPVDLVGEVDAAREAGITVSTIAIGEQADFARLRALADAGDGRYYEALDVSTLPRIFAGEAMTVSRTLLREGPGAPQVRPHPLLAGSGRPPAPNAYVATTLKPDAEALWTYGDEEPLLAVRRQQLGRTAAFTSDLGGLAGALGRWPELPTVLGDLVRWLAARPERFAAQVRQDGDDASLVVDAVEDGRFLDGLSLTARAGGREQPLRAVGPGRYATDLPAAAAGEPIVVSQGGEVVARARYLAQNPELRTGDGRAALERLAETSGGRVLSPGDAWDPGPAPRPRSLAPWALGLAGLLFLSELVLRRVRLT